MKSEAILDIFKQIRDLAGCDYRVTNVALFKIKAIAEAMIILLENEKNGGDNNNE